MQRLPQVLAVAVFAASYALIAYTHPHTASGLWAGLYTVAVGGGVWLLYSVLGFPSGKRPALRRGLAYTVFFITPVLTLTGHIGVLTGFMAGHGVRDSTLPWLGVSFVTAGLALHVFTGTLSVTRLVGHILHPLRWNSGPCALPVKPHLMRPSWRPLRWRRVKFYGAWVVLGAFFYGVLAVGLAPLLVLKESADALDILAFSVAFEAYVYFNFSGISFMVFGVLNLVGVKTDVNFKSPFAARDVIGYWQRWHTSLGAVFKPLFFNPLKARWGLSAAVLGVFACSALWHGVSLNFMLWGVFHATGWLLTYRLARGPFKRWGRWLNMLLFPVIVVFGRLIFSELDMPTLLFKLRQVMHFEGGRDAWLLHLEIDAQTGVTLLIAALVIAAEALLPQQCGTYRLWQQPWVTLLLLAVTLTLGSTGLGGVYGTR